MFKDIDGYKVIIIACAVLLLIVGWFLMGVEDDIAEAEKAIQKERGRSGYLYRIGEEQRKWQTVQSNQRTNERLQNTRVFFQGMVMSSDGEGPGGLKETDFTITEKTVPVNSNVEDVEVTIDFGTGNDEKILTQSYIHSLCFNVENKAPVWRLRQLTMKNVEVEKLRRPKVPPDEIADRWSVDRLVFARRKPEEDDRR